MSSQAGLQDQGADRGGGEPAGINYFLTEYDLAQTADPAELAGMLGRVASAHGPLDGAWARAHVSLRSFEPGEVEPDHHFGGIVEGTMTSAGTFDLLRTYGTSTEDGPSTSTHRTTFDGHTLRDLEVGKSSGIALRPTAASWQLSLETYSQLPVPLFWWVFDPFELPAFEGMVFDEVPGPEADQVLVRVMVDGSGGEYVGLQYTIDTSGARPRPLERLTLTSRGEPLALTEYSDYRVVADGVWRPRSIVETVFHRGEDAGQPAGRTAITVAATRRLTREEVGAVPPAFDPALDWIVWE